MKVTNFHELFVWFKRLSNSDFRRLRSCARKVLLTQGAIRIQDGLEIESSVTDIRESFSYEFVSSSQRKLMRRNEGGLTDYLGSLLACPRPTPTPLNRHVWDL